MIRKIKQSEISACVNLIKNSFFTVAQEYNITIENAPRYVAYATNVEKLESQYFEGRPMFAYFNKNKEMIGYYSLYIQENNECELNNLCVLPQYRNKGIGKELIEHAFQYAKSMGCKQMNIGIVEENTKLRRWYENYGAEHIGTKKFDFFPFTCGYMKKIL